MEVVGVADRIRWILKTRGWAQRELSRRAKLKSQSHVGLILRNDAAKVESLVAIARAANVPFAWLANGEGSPNETAPPGIQCEDIYPNRAEAVKRLAGIVRPETISWLLSRRLQNDKEDQSVKQWIDDALTYERYRDKFGDLFDRGPDGA